MQFTHLKSTVHGDAVPSHPPRLRRGTRWGLSRPVAPFPLTLGTGSGRLAIPGEAGRVPLRFLPIP